MDTLIALIHWVILVMIAGALLYAPARIYRHRIFYGIVILVSSSRLYYMFPHETSISYVMTMLFTLYFSCIFYYGIHFNAIKSN